ncbi:tRNA dihydrouridine synthase DusB [Collinsella sp. zg1085]|uniref:tRNA dihydrouridine synthase DusB n=1 Tax=Collinsella sp. zg1085 TaxID=2844380 RepID=UPI001C0C1A12|nr:tRNA dihydrouridine synthase DusB [Collinsella sp. zg1085]QWT16977.1 tRNA dihydrouridine synthase DusB [Collinsella sp. zg1085]
MTSPYPQAIRDRLNEQPFLLAPMAGVTDAAYRMMCYRHGAQLAYSEMVSVAGLAFASEKTWDLVLPADEEPHIAVQLFGSKPEQFASAVHGIQNRLQEKLALIDINMACPARKVITKGEGSALLDQPELAEAIVRACTREAQVPVTVKLRRAFRSGPDVAPDIAARLEAAGIAAVAIHGRTASQLYTGRADWSVIDAVAARVQVPVIGSGDVMSAADAVHMLSSTKASGVMVARGSYGNPWIFEDALQLLHAGTIPRDKQMHERLDALAEHIDLTHKTGAHMRRARSFASWYLKGMPHAAAWRASVVKCESYEDFRRLIDDMRTHLSNVDDSQTEHHSSRDA